MIRKNRNIWVFFISYFVHYGTFVAFAANCNFIIKPYGYTDIEIAINAVLLMMVGTTGAILLSLYIKKTSRYRFTLRFVVIGAAIMIIVLCIWLNTANNKIITGIIISLMGFIGTPEMPLCY